MFRDKEMSNIELQDFVKRVENTMDPELFKMLKGVADSIINEMDGDPAIRKTIENLFYQESKKQGKSVFSSGS